MGRSYEQKFDKNEVNILDNIRSSDFIFCMRSLIVIINIIEYLILYNIILRYCKPVDVGLLLIIFSSIIFIGKVIIEIALLDNYILNKLCRELNFDKELVKDISIKLVGYVRKEHINVYFIVGEHWEHPRKDGGPDLRFRNNISIPTTWYIVLRCLNRNYVISSVNLEKLTLILENLDDQGYNMIAS